MMIKTVYFDTGWWWVNESSRIWCPDHQRLVSVVLT